MRISKQLTYVVNCVLDIKVNPIHRENNEYAISTYSASLKLCKVDRAKINI